MKSYYVLQGVSPNFSGHHRQRGRGFGALGAGIGRAAPPIARKFVLPAVKRIGKELILQAVPELIEVASKRKTSKKALKSTVNKTVRKQVRDSIGAYCAERRKSVEKSQMSKCKQKKSQGSKTKVDKKTVLLQKSCRQTFKRKKTVTRSRS